MRSGGRCGGQASNTLRMRRLGLVEGASQEILAAYIALPTLQVRPLPQRYTGLKKHADPAIDRDASGTFQADRCIDRNGLVIDDPGVWQRPPSGWCR